MAACTMLVVAGALRDGDGRILVAQRPGAKAHGGLWEFPGGKVEPGETLDAALARELAEELGVAIDLRSISPIGFATRPLAERELILLLFAIDCWAGEPTALEHQALAWHPVAAIRALPMPPADTALLAALARHIE